MTEKKKPRPEDFGWIDGGLTEPGGWQLEGGEEAYYEALDKYHMKDGILRNGNSLD